jgi:hypothetical protein
MAGADTAAVRNPGEETMKKIVPAFALALLAGCATTASVPAGMQPGKFVQFSCAGGKMFSARAAEGGATVRVRAHHGAAELDRKGDGVYEGEGYRLVVTAGSGAVSLMHGGKPEASQCKAAV